MSNHISRIIFKKAIKLSQKIHDLEAHILFNTECQDIEKHRQKVKTQRKKLQSLGYHLVTKDEKGYPHMTYSFMEPLSKLN